MGCHFQLSLSRAESQPVRQTGMCGLIARLRRDGEQWEARPVEMDAELPVGGYLWEPVSREDIRKFPLEGPEGLEDELPLTQLGWCMRCVPALHDELMDMTGDDRLSFNGQEFPGQPWKPLLAQSITLAKALGEQELLDDATAPAAGGGSRPRF